MAAGVVDRYAVIASGCASCPRLKCQRDGCNTSFCYHCKQYWHPNQTCDMARQRRITAMLRSGSLSYSHDSAANNRQYCPHSHRPLVYQPFIKD